MEFIILFLHRSISGLQNGLGYKDDQANLGIFSMLFGLATILLAYFLIQDLHGLRKLLTLTFLAVSSIGIIMVFNSFDDLLSINWLPRDIHFWEILATGGAVLGMAAAGGNIILVIASVYPGLILHKGFVNWGSGLPFWDARTDDPSGKTFNIPLLNIKIPRSSTAFRIVLAVLSLVAAALTYFNHWNIAI